MWYRYYNLGHQQADSSVVVRVRGSAANVILLDPVNFHRYRKGQAFFYTGGYFRQSPVRLQIPEDGHWYVVIDHGGYKGRAIAEIEVLAPDQAGTATDLDASLMEAA